MRAVKVLLGLAAGVAFAWLMAFSWNSAWKSPDPPGEPGGAAAVGSGYGVGIARQAHIFRGERIHTGPSPYEDTRELGLQKGVLAGDGVAVPRFRRPAHKH